MKANKRTVLKYAGAYISFEIGSGYASGQEIMQFFTSYGIWGLGAVLIALVLFTWLGSTLLTAGYDRRRRGGSLFDYYCGSYWGKLLEWLSTALLFVSGAVMISGAGATLHEYYGLPYLAGCLLMTLLVFVTMLLGLNRLVDILGVIGPGMILFVLFIGTVTLIRNSAQLPTNLAAAPSLALPRAAGSWWFSGILYATFPLIGSIPFLGAMGASATSRRDAFWGGIWGGALLMAATFVMNLALASDIGAVGRYAIPTLYLADRISPLLGQLFSVVILCEIYSTAAPMLWSAAHNINMAIGGGKPRRFLPVGLGVCAAGLLCGLLPFELLVGTVYPYKGYIGLVLMICIAGKGLRGRRLEKAQGSDL